MKKPLIGVILGAVVLFLWGMISWMVLPWHDWTIKPLPEEQLISDTLKTVVEEPGFYFFPSDKVRSRDGNVERLDQEIWTEKYKKGPIGALIFSPQGRDPMGPVNFLTEIFNQLVIAALVMLVMSLSRDRIRGVGGRILLSAVMGTVAGLAILVPYWNWFHFPCGFTSINFIDTIAGFSLLGLVMAKFVPE